MPTISYLLPGLGSTGGYIVIYNFMDQLVSRGWKVYAVTPKRAIEWSSNGSENIIKSKYDVNLRNRSSVIFDYLIKSYFGESCFRKILTLKDGGFIENAEKLAKNCPNCDVVVATAWSTAYAANMLAEKYITAYHMQHYEEVFATTEYERGLIRATYGFPLFNIANSKWLADIMSTVWDRKLPIVNPGIDNKLFYSDKASVKSKYSNISHVKMVSYADDRPCKAWEDTVKIMKSVFQSLGSNYHVEWIIFGGGIGDTDGLPAQHLGKIEPSKLADLYRSAHIVMMPSWYESFPLPPIEAMACGTAVVCTKFGTEDYAVHRKNALVSQPRAINELTNFVIELVHNRDLMLDLVLHGLDTAQDFTWDNVTNRLEDVLYRAIDLGQSVRATTKSLSNFTAGQMDAFSNIGKICWWNNIDIANVWKN